MEPDPLSIFLTLFSIELLSYQGLFIIFILLVGSTFLGLVLFLSALERSLQTIVPSELKLLRNTNKAIINKLQDLFERAEHLDTLFKITKLFCALLAATALVALFVFFKHNIWVSVILTFLLILVFSNLLPRIIFKNNEKTVQLCTGLSYPILKLFLPLANALAPLEPTLPEDDVSLEELKTAFKGSAQNSPNISQLNLYKQVLRFDKITIKNVMRPKHEIVGIRTNYNLKEVLAKIQSSSFSRLPVYDDEWNNILGIIHCKDLLPYSQESELVWNQFIRPIIFVNEKDFAQDVLRIFQKGKNHMAIVLNNDKEITGIVTLEDITEEIIGEIDDE